MNAPEGLLYSKTHEWLKKNDDGTALIGLTDFAQNSLGDIVYVDFSVDVDDSVGKNDTICDVESVKAVDSSYSPVTATILEINEALDDDYSVINSDCYGAGWFMKIKIENPDELSELMDAAAYTKHCESQ